MNVKERAVVLLSGGLDSATAAALAKEQGMELYCVSFDYGQRHARELDAARAVARALGAAEHRVIRVDPEIMRGSALTDPHIEVPKDRRPGGDGGSIPATYVPARNTLFLAHALSWAEVIGASRLVIGANAIDYSGYPDCRPAFLQAFETMANLATKAGVEGRVPFRIFAPLVHMTKAGIIGEGVRLGLDYAMTWSCYDPAPGGSPCGRCDSCLLRAKGFEEAGVPDPLIDCNDR